MLSATPLTDELEVGAIYPSDSYQIPPLVASDAEGNFVVVWEFNDNPDQTYLNFTLFSADGVKGATTTVVHTLLSDGTIEYPSVDMDAFGNFVIGWIEVDTTDGFQRSVHAQTFDAGGDAISSDVVVDDDDTLIDPGDADLIETSVSINPNGVQDDEPGFVVAYNLFGGAQTEVRARLYDIDGTPVGDHFVVDGYSFDGSYAVTSAYECTYAAMDASGRFAIVYFDDRVDLGTDGEYVARFDSDGTLLGRDLALSGPGNIITASIAMDWSGDYALLYQTIALDPLYVQLYDAAGTPQGSAIEVDDINGAIPLTASISMAPTGEFVVAWATTVIDFGDPFVMAGGVARGYYADGTLLFSDTQVNDEDYFPSLATGGAGVSIDSHGNFVVAWNHSATDGNGGDLDDIHVRRFSSGITGIIDNPSTITGRYLFYNQSKFDGGDPAINAGDDGAMATDKVPYFAGDGLAGPANATAYSLGLNGIMIDFDHFDSTPTASDFTFRIGTSNDPGTWTAAPSPAAISVRPGAGTGGSDRIEIVWDNNDIENTWLQVTVNGYDATGGYNLNAGLVSSDVFYFGNLIGDTFVGEDGTGVPSLSTNVGDEVGVRNNYNLGQPVTNVYDFDKNGNVNIADEIIARTHYGLLAKINIASPSALPAAAVAADLSAVLSGLRVPPDMRLGGAPEADRYETNQLPTVTSARDQAPLLVEVAEMEWGVVDEEDGSTAPLDDELWADLAASRRD